MGTFEEQMQVQATIARSPFDWLAGSGWMRTEPSNAAVGTVTRGFEDAVDTVGAGVPVDLVRGPLRDLRELKALIADPGEGRRDLGEVSLTTGGNYYRYDFNYDRRVHDGIDRRSLPAAARANRSTRAR